ncbi:MAG: transaldolase, partial [Acidobacteria bacterium]|nr:transaldolase [Acidobacteriota bacterium]
LDVPQLLDRAERVVQSCSQAVPVAENPGARLGAALAECALAGRDKLTVVADARVGSFGLWVEQLIAESTGKEGKGIVPVAGEPLAAPSAYGDDRAFVSIAVGRADDKTEAALQELEAAGHPVVRRTLSDAYDLGEEFFLWEFATAFAGWRLGINPFDQPNVQESKDATKELLETFARDGELQEQSRLVSDDGLTVYADERLRERLAGATAAEVIGRHLASAKPGDYVALLDYFEETPEHERLVQELRTCLRDATRCAVTTGYGPRFLHSTGQLHKGGSDAGVFIQLTADDRSDLPIPEQPYTFSTLKQAQALGDFRSLASRGRRALRVHLGADVAAGLRRLKAIIAGSVPARQAGAKAEGQGRG